MALLQNSRSALWSPSFDAFPFPLAPFYTHLVSHRVPIPTTMQRTTALTELDTLLATSPVHPAPLVALLQQLELKRQYSLEMARQLLTNNTFINDEKTFVDNFIARAGHVEAQRRFQVIDASWRCLVRLYC